MVAISVDKLIFSLKRPDGRTFSGAVKSPSDEQSFGDNNLEKQPKKDEVVFLSDQMKAQIDQEVDKEINKIIKKKNLASKEDMKTLEPSEKDEKLLNNASKVITYAGGVARGIMAGIALGGLSGAVTFAVRAAQDKSRKPAGWVAGLVGASAFVANMINAHIKVQENKS